MRLSAERILTTHAGNLVLTAVMRGIGALALGDAYDGDHIAADIQASIDEVVQKLVEVGVDIPSDGEYRGGDFAGRLRAVQLPRLVEMCRSVPWTGGQKESALDTQHLAGATRRYATNVSGTRNGIECVGMGRRQVPTRHLFPNDEGAAIVTESTGHPGRRAFRPFSEHCTDAYTPYGPMVTSDHSKTLPTIRSRSEMAARGATPTGTSRIAFSSTLARSSAV